MAYFLKKTKRNDRLYLSIYESFYSPETKNTRHKSFRKIGFVDALIEQGIDDPISHFQKEVNELNSKRETEKCRINFQQISDVSPELCLGYVPIAKILNILDVKEHFGYLRSSSSMYMMSFPLLYMLVLLRLYPNIRLFMIFFQSYMFKKTSVMINSWRAWNSWAKNMRNWLKY